MVVRAGFSPGAYFDAWLLDEKSEKFIVGCKAIFGSALEPIEGPKTVAVLADIAVQRVLDNAITRRANLQTPLDRVEMGRSKRPATTSFSVS